MKISIIVPAFNEEKLIIRTLREIRLATTVFHTQRWETELIVCDNNSTDRTAELAREAGATVVFEPVNQIARARNQAAAAAAGDWLIFIDADSHPSAELFAEVAAQIQSGRCLAGGCTLNLDGAYPFAAGCITRLWNCLSRMQRLMAGSFIFCEAAAFREVGGFSRELFAGEELDLSRRLKKLARERQKHIVILHRHPLVTSPRKVHLYSAWEHLGFLARTIFGGGRTLTDRKSCFPWYDGRR